MSNYLKLAISILFCELAGILGSLFTVPSIPSWYSALQKAALNPPAWIFAPVWTALFALMGTAFYLIWIKNGNKKEIKNARTIFFGQLILNILWTIIFFGLHNPLLAFIEIVLLWFAILATIISFYKISKLAAYFLLPYILWVSFASYLNFSVWMLNR
jgi:translocator protein